VIEKILITNVERFSLRRHCALGVLASLGYPVSSDVLSFHKAHDHKKYATSEAVQRAAIEDGWLFFEHFESGVGAEVGRVLDEKKSAIWLWTWVSCLREIIRADKLTLLLIDDRSPTITWECMNEMVREVYNDAFRGIQLDVFMFLRIEFYSIIPTHAITSRCGRGFVAENDMGFILSPNGARFLLDAIRQNPGNMPHTTTKWRMEPGFYHVLESVTAQNCGLPRWLGWDN